MRHIIPISGKDSLATALVQSARSPSLKYEYLFCDVSMELPETYQWLSDVEVKLGINIKRIGRSLIEVIKEQNMLPSPTMRFCTPRAKIFPLRDYLDGQDATQYIGIRSDEDYRTDSLQSPDNVDLVFPLIEENISLSDVYRILSENKVLPPAFFWKRLYDDVYEMCSGYSRKFIESLTEWQRSYLFSWRSRSNCYMCFYQRLYEWVGLLEHHPDLFEAAEQLENQYGSNGGVRLTGERAGRTLVFTLRQEGPLATVKSRAKGIYESRAQKVWNTIKEMRHNPDEDLMATSSCGIYCGK